MDRWSREGKSGLVAGRLPRGQAGIARAAILPSQGDKRLFVDGAFTALSNLWPQTRATVV